MKKAFRWIAVVLLSPVLLFALLTALLYVAPIQNWAVRQAAAYASQQTGMDISVEHVDISFPLNLALDGVLVKTAGSRQQAADTLLYARRAVADVKLWPLLGGKVEIDGLELRDTRLDTADMISDLSIVGAIGELRIDRSGAGPTIGIDLDEMTACLHRPRLSDADLRISISDTGAVDTSTVGWHIRFDQFLLERSRLAVTLPPGPPPLTVSAKALTLSDADLHLGLGRFALGRISVEDGALAHDSLFSLTAINLGLDSLYYHGTDLRVGIRHAGMTDELTGLQLTRLEGAVAMDGDSISLKDLYAATPHSRLSVDGGICLAPTAADVTLDASLGKADLLALAGELPADLWPVEPLTLKGHVSGDARQLCLEDLHIDLPALFHAEAAGSLGSLDHMEQLTGQLQLNARTGRLTPLLRHFGLPDEYSVPDGLSMQGTLKAGAPGNKLELTAGEGEGTISLQATFDYSEKKPSAYSLQAVVSNVDLRHFIPAGSLGLVSADVELSGRGTDPFAPGTAMEGNVLLHHLDYGALPLDSIVLAATLANGVASATLTSSSPLLSGTVATTANVASLRQPSSSLKATADASISRADLLALGLDDAPIVLAMDCNLELETDLQLTHRLSALADNIYIRDTLKTHRPEKFGLLLKTSPDTVVARIQSGDLIVKADASGDYEQLAARLTALADTIAAQQESRTIDQAQLKRLLPTARLYVASQRSNPVATMLRSSLDTDFKDLHIDLTASPAAGLNGTARLHGLTYGSTRIDTMRLSLVDKGNHLSFNGQLTNSRKNPMAVFNILFDGLLQEHGASFGTRYFDERGKQNVRIGAKVEMVDQGLRFQLIPAKPTLGYKEFTLNAGNYLLLHRNMRVEADIDLKAEDGTRLKVYSGNPGANAAADEAAAAPLLQDVTVSVHRLDLGELTRGLAMLPNIDGMLEGDYHLMRDADRNLQVASDMSVSGMAYEGSHIGNIGSEFVYMLREDDSHAVDAMLQLDGEPVGTLQGSYWAGGRLDAVVQLDQMPLRIANGFMPDRLIGFEGTADGTLSVKGTADRLQADGEVRFDKGCLVSEPYGMRMRFGDKPLQVKDSKLLFDDFALYAYNENPLNITGNIDFSNASNSAVDLRMRARNFQLINARQTKESVAYGKMYVNFFTRLSGSIDQLRMRGRLDVLGTTDLHYIMLDSPLSTDNQMDDLVRFTDFADTTQTVVKRPESDALDIDVQLNIDQGVHAHCALNTDQTNYVDLLGGGDLRLRMGDDGLSLTGRYTIGSGTMKYSMPVIPLKTFTIKEGSYVEFTGDPMNPTLHLTATERTRAAVSGDDGQSRSVSFDCGVVITQTLESMGLQFTIAAPEDMQVQSELSSMSSEQQGKLAVTMLTTGMYLADGNTSGFTMNSALSSFLQSEINNITAGALKTVDLQVGVDNSTDGAGQMHTDYSFKFAKRFWNNRLNVQIGGKVSTGQEVEGQQQSFFDNVTMEYRLSPTSNQYLKLFYKQNVYDWLEGYTGEYGGGYIWRKKLDSLLDIFKKNAQPKSAQPPQRPAQALPAGGVPHVTETDSLQSNETRP